MEGFYGGRVRLDKLVAKIPCHVTDFYIPDHIKLNGDLRSASMDGGHRTSMAHATAHALGTCPWHIPLAPASGICLFNRDSLFTFFSKIKMRGPWKGSMKRSMDGITGGL